MSRLVVIFGLLLGLFTNLCLTSPTKTHVLKGKVVKRDCTPTPTAISAPSCAPWLIGQHDTGEEVCVSLNSNKDGIVVSYPAVSDYNYDVVHVWIGTTKPTETNPGGYPWSSDKTPSICTVNGQTASCNIPFNDPSFPKVDLCSTPFYIVTHASVTSPTLGSETGTGGAPGNCIDPACHPWFVYWGFSIACGCTPPPTTQWCGFGTAFGYSTPPKTLNSLMPLPNTCKRWGWYTLTSSPVSGTLYVGAGGNDISKATAVGTWSATISGQSVDVTYTLSNNPPNNVFQVTEVHVYASCAKPTTCAPGQYTYSQNGLTAQSYDTGPINTGCNGPWYIIVHAAVSQQLSSTATCPNPIP